MSGLSDALLSLAAGTGLTESQAKAAIESIMVGAESESLIAAFLTALRIRGETEDDLAGAVAAVREVSNPWAPLEPPVACLDTCGTGGDGANTVNISTAAAIVVASVGVAVAKHGNRSASGNSGSAEVLVELGVAIDAELPVLARCLRELGITFLFAPRFHPAMRHAAPVRKLLPFRTLFNLVGPLANPARPAYQLIGVPTVPLADLMARTVARLGTTRSAIVVGSDGLDEVSLSGPTSVRWVEHGEVSERAWEPADFGLPTVRTADLQVTSPADSAARLRSMLRGEPGPVLNTVLANSAAALLVTGRASTLAEGVALAAEAIRAGRSADLLDRWARLSRGEASPGEVSPPDR